MSQFSPIVPLVGKGITKFQPIWVEDLTNIIYKLVKKNISNVTVEVGGSQIITFEDIIKFILKEMEIKRLLFKISFSHSKRIAYFMEKMPKAILTRDQVELLKKNNVVTKKYDYKKLITYTPQDFFHILSKQLILFKKGGGHLN